MSGRPQAARYAHLADDPVNVLNATIGETIALAIGLNKPPMTSDMDSELAAVSDL